MSFWDSVGSGFGSVVESVGESVGTILNGVTTAEMDKWAQPEQNAKTEPTKGVNSDGTTVVAQAGLTTNQMLMIGGGGIAALLILVLALRK